MTWWCHEFNKINVTKQSNLVKVCYEWNASPTVGRWTIHRRDFTAGTVSLGCVHERPSQPPLARLRLRATRDPQPPRDPALHLVCLQALLARPLFPERGGDELQFPL